jgi:rhodanese-related sulfurtransferase
MYIYNYSNLFYKLSIIAFISISICSHLLAQPADNQIVADNTTPAKNTIEILNLQEYAAVYDVKNSQAKVILPKELSTRLQAGERITVLDARSLEEYNISHIRQARRVGFSDFSSERIWMYNRQKPIVVYCAVGERSRIVADYLLYVGFSNVSILEQSIIGWVNAGFALVDSKNITTNYVHIGSKDNQSLLKKGRAKW